MRVRITLSLIAAVVLLSGMTEAQTRIEIFIPEGMPVQIEVKHDQSALHHNKYLITRKTALDVHKVKMFILAANDTDRKGHGSLIWSVDDDSPASISWPMDEKVNRLIVIVQRVETDDGVWLIDAPDSIAEMEQAVKHSDLKLMRARFIKEVKVEQYIPSGMEPLISLEVWRDEKEQSITKYRYRRNVAPEVTKATIIALMVGADGKVLPGIGDVPRMSTTRLSDPAEVAWGSMAEVRRLVFIVERIETKDGAWVLDSEDQQADIKAIVERGKEALPKARFIKQY
jgi:hypothetical protein